MKKRDIKGRFIKGLIPWNKGKHPLYMQGKNHPMFGKHPTAWNKGKKNIFSQDTLKKMRLAKLGKVGNKKGTKVSIETRKKLSIALKGRVSPNKGKFMPWLSGSNHWCWKGGITPLMRKIRHSLKYSEWRKTCFIRDNHTCQMCYQRGGNLEVDHTKPFAIIIEENNIKTFEEAMFCVELWDINNGKTLCRDCHEMLPTTNRRERDVYGKFIGFQQISLEIIN